jgi:hypothetical protein
MKQGTTIPKSPLKTYNQQRQKAKATTKSRLDSGGARACEPFTSIRIVPSHHVRQKSRSRRRSPLANLVPGQCRRWRKIVIIVIMKN